MAGITLTGTLGDATCAYTDAPISGEAPYPRQGAVEPQSTAEWRQHDVSPPRLKDHILLGTLSDRRFRVLEPFEVACTIHDDRVEAYATEIEEFGFGDDAYGAIRDLQRAIVDLYSVLSADEGKLGTDLARVWELLKTRIAREK